MTVSTKPKATAKQAAAILFRTVVQNVTNDETLGQYLGGWSAQEKQRVYDEFAKLQEAALARPAMARLLSKAASLGIKHPEDLATDSTKDERDDYRADSFEDDGSASVGDDNEDWGRHPDGPPPEKGT